MQKNLCCLHTLKNWDSFGWNGYHLLLLNLRHLMHYESSCKLDCLDLIDLTCCRLLPCPSFVYHCFVVFYCLSEFGGSNKGVYEKQDQSHAYRTYKNIVQQVYIYINTSSRTFIQMVQQDRYQM